MSQMEPLPKIFHYFRHDREEQLERFEVNYFAFQSEFSPAQDDLLIQSVCIRSQYLLQHFSSGNYYSLDGFPAVYAPLFSSHTKDPIVYLVRRNLAVVASCVFAGN